MNRQFEISHKFKRVVYVPIKVLLLLLLISLIGCKERASEKDVNLIRNLTQLKGG